MSEPANPQGVPLPPQPGALKLRQSEAGLAPLVLTLVELLRQLMEAQVIRRMEAGQLSDAEIERAANSLRAIEEQIVQLCEVLEIDPEQLNLDLGEAGSLLPKRGSYYPGRPAAQASVLELLDRLISTGVVLEGDLDLGVAQMDLIHLKLRILLTSSSKLG